MSRISSAITPGESVLWVGRPEAGLLVRRSLPKAFLGLGVIACTLVWMYAVVRGGHNGWDRGRAVAPFAPHNILIAACGGLWVLPFGLYLLSWPLRTWRKAPKIVYVLTDSRAVVIEPDCLGRDRIDPYPPESLILMRCDEREDGSGDLIFDNRRTWAGVSQAVGFLAVDRVRRVEDMVREALLTPGPSVRQSTTTPSQRRIYRISGVFRLYQAVGLAVGGISAICLVGNLVVALAVLILMPQRILSDLDALAADRGGPGPLGVVFGIVVGLGAIAVVGLAAWNAFRFALATPTEIEVAGDGEMELRSWLRTSVLKVGDVTSITTGGWLDLNRIQAVITHKGGRVVLINLFPDFKNLLATVKDLNPEVEVRGF